MEAIMATKKATTKKATEGERVRGVDVSKVVPAVLVKYTKLCDIEDGANVKANVEAYVLWIEKNVPTNRLADCDTCGGASDGELPECPFCGTGGVEGMTPPAPPAEVAPAAVTPAETAPAPEVIPGDAPPAQDAPATTGAKKVKRSKASKAPAAVEPEAAEQPAAAAPAEIPDDDGTSDPNAIPAAVPPAKASGIAPSTSSSFEPVVSEVLGPQNTEELDRAVEAVHSCKGTAVWDLGRSIVRTYENDLWKQRRDAKGSPTYSGFGAFCQAELGISPQHAYKVMDVSLRYTRDEAVQIGVAKLGVIMRLPAGSDGERKMLESATSTPLSALATKVRELAAGKVRDTGRKHIDTPQRQGKPAEPVVPEGSITVALTIGSEKVPMFCKGKVGISRARTLADSPVGEELLMNGVVQRYKLTSDKDGNLLLIVERRHVDTKPEAKPEAKAPKASKPAKPAKGGKSKK
jgi:hypothetical protein